MGTNTNNLGLSSTSTRQLERMIDDAAWITDASVHHHRITAYH
jgi:hypothetical protein